MAIIEQHVEERGLEICSICDELTEIAMRAGEFKVCYHCLDDAE